MTKMVIDPLYKIDDDNIYQSYLPICKISLQDTNHFRSWKS